MRQVILTLLIFVGFESFGQTTQEVKFSNVSINSMGDIQWTVTYVQNDGFSIHVEKLVNGKWTKLDQGLSGSGEAPRPRTLTTMTHTTRVKFHKGINIYRLVMTSPTKRVSDEIKLDSDVSNDDDSLWIVNNKIILDEKVVYEILNSTGATVTKGENEIIDISNLPSGSYFLYTKTSTRQFTK